LSSSDRVSPQTEAERSQRPPVSIIVATYGRHEVLSYAIRSALAQDYKDFELIVVGDAASEDTSVTVAEFADPRIRYINLPRNFGEQSGPNNIGIQLARGRYIAFLNQDDLWFSDHLAIAVEWLEATFSDIVFALGAIIEAPSTAPREKNDWSASKLTGTTRNGFYDPVTTIAPTSTWLVRREAIETLKGFRPGRECVVASSQDLLLRAWRAGFNMRGVPNLSVLLLESGARTNSYASSSAEENEFFWNQLHRSETHLRISVLERMRPTKRYSWLGYYLRHLRWLWRRGLAASGIHPLELQTRRRYGWSVGRFIQFLRKKRGLEPMPSPDLTREDLLSFYKSILPGRSGSE
jgi:glycosyltransferase involved in cell wall biosynthesis